MFDDVFLALIASPLILFGIWVAWQILLERVRDKAVEQISEDDFQRLANELRGVGSTESKGFFLRKRSAASVSGTFHVVLPEEMDVEWLKGARIRVELTPQPQSDDDLGTVTVVGQREIGPHFDLVPIPRICFKNGGGANQYAAKVWFKRNPRLFQLAKELYPRDPDGFLTSLFWGAGRVNSPFEWLQSPPRIRCDNCSKKLLPILQVNGGAVGLEAEAEYYVAACTYETGGFKIFMQMT